MKLSIAKQERIKKLFILLTKIAESCGNYETADQGGMVHYVKIAMICGLGGEWPEQCPICGRFFMQRSICDHENSQIKPTETSAATHPSPASAEDLFVTISNFGREVKVISGKITHVHLFLDNDKLITHINSKISDQLRHIDKIIHEGYWGQTMG